MEDPELGRAYARELADATAVQASSRYTMSAVLTCCSNLLSNYNVSADLVILGCGTQSRMVSPALQSYFRQHNIAFEAIDTVMSECVSVPTGRVGTCFAAGIRPLK